MTALMLAFLRYFFLLLLYILIIYLCWMMFKGLTKEKSLTSGDPLTKVSPSWQDNTGDIALLLVLSSYDPLLEIGSSLLIKKEIFIGRSENNDLVINDPYVSLKHAKLAPRDGQYWLEDLNSLNGTFLNEIKIKNPVPVTNGDRLKIGRVVLQFVRWVYEVEPSY